MNSNFIKVDLISRFFQEDEEMLILTHSDELNRIYGEDNRSPFNTITTRSNTSCDDTRRNRSFLTEQDNPSMRERPAPSPMRSTSTSWQDSPAFKETRATVISSGPSTITITSAVSTADSLWFKNTRSYGKERRSSELGSNSEENPSFNQDQGNKRRSYRLTGDNMQKQRLLEDEGEKRGEESVEGTSQFCTSLEEERTRMTLANPVQNPSTGTAGRNPPATITTWEAGWNVTNAIQVRNLSHA